MKATTAKAGPSATEAAPTLTRSSAGSIAHSSELAASEGRCVGAEGKSYQQVAAGRHVAELKGARGSQRDQTAGGRRLAGKRLWVR